MMSVLRTAASPRQYCPPTARRQYPRRPRPTCKQLGESRPARRAVLGTRRGTRRRTSHSAVDFLSTSAREPVPRVTNGAGIDPHRLRTLQSVGMLCGVTAGAWLGAAEAPTKLVTLGLSPVVISLGMVIGVFLARWTLPALIQGTSYVAADLRQAPHLIVWAVLAGCLWAVANTLTIFAVRDVGLSIAFPLWNSNSLLGILWGIVFFRALRGAGGSRVASLGSSATCSSSTRSKTRASPAAFRSRISISYGGSPGESWCSASCEVRRNRCCRR